jgi:hypothetical protein
VRTPTRTRLAVAACLASSLAATARGEDPAGGRTGDDPHRHLAVHGSQSTGELGPSVVAISMPGHRVLGALVNQIGSVAGASASQMLIRSIGKLPFAGNVSADYNAVRPDIGPEWTLRVQLPDRRSKVIETPFGDEWIVHPGRTGGAPLTGSGGVRLEHGGVQS